MRRSWVPAVVIVLIALAGAATVQAAEPTELRRLFPHEADVFVEQDGLSRLVLSSEVLAACGPDLSDLRLFDAQGREAPFLVDAVQLDAGKISQRFEPPLVETARAEVRREDGPPLRRETFELEMPSVVPQTGNWVLVLSVRQSEFVARVQVEGIDENAEPTALVTDSSVFRMRGVRRAEKLRLPLPSFGGRRLRVILETEHSFWLAPGFRLESARVLERGGRIAVPLEVLSSRSADGRTVVDLARPRGIVPDLLRIETATGTFDRKVEVWDEGPVSADTALASSNIFRVEALVPVGETELTLRPARGDRLRVEIDDGDSPPLAELTFAVVMRQPSLIFSLPAAGPGQAAGTLRFGGGRAHLPRYDLAGLLPRLAQTATGTRAEAAALLYDPAAVRPAHVGATRPNPGFDGAPALAFAMRAGAEINRRVFSHRRPLRVPAATEGLSRLRLEPADLAVLNDDLSDLRVADEASDQWPYLLDRGAVTDLIPLEVEGPDREGGRSSYALRAPVSPLRFDRVLLDTDAGFFDRPFRLEGVSVDGEERLLASARLSRPIGDPRPVRIDVTQARVESMRLVVEDGDDAPLEFRSVQARVLLPELFLTAPEGSYALLLGAPDQGAPRYELERVRAVVLAVKAATIEAGLLEQNPDYSLQARLRGRGLQQTILFWAVLLAAVVVLAFLTLRLARRDSA